MYNNYDGSGLFDIFRTKEEYHRNTQRMIEMYGNQIIQRMQVQRTNIPRALNFVFSKVLPYDQLYHLGILLTLDGKNLLLEKQSYINLTDNFKIDSSTTTMDVPLLGQQITLNDLLASTRRLMGESNYFRYDPFKNNCQNFCKEVIRSRGLLSPRLEDFIYQKNIATSKNVPGALSTASRFVTDAHNIFSRFTGGDDDVY